MSTDFLFDETAPVNEDEEALFLDRLELFLERSLDEFRHFAEREGRDFLQVRQEFKLAGNNYFSCTYKIYVSDKT